MASVVLADVKTADPSSQRELEFTQADENHEAQFVVLHDPALPNWMGSLHPNGSLYEKPLDLAAAQAQHAKFRAELEKAGCKVMTVREILAKDCDVDVVARVKLEDLAASCLTYELIGDEKQLTNKEAYLMSDQYKHEVVEKMDTNQLVEIVLTRPTIYLKKADKDTELSAQNYTFAREVSIMKFCFQKLRVPIIGEVKWPGTLEGGDFFPAGQDLCFVGVGLRSNMYAVNQLFDKDLWGTRRVAVVKDYFDQDQQRMHLDTVFNIIGTRVCLLLETVMGQSSPRRRLVDEYVRTEGGQYKMSRHDVEFSTYLVEEGYKIIPCTEEMQHRYGCNGLNLGKNTMITVDKLTAKHIARSEIFTGRIIVIDFDNITNMYGSVHCCSQVISRRDPTRITSVQRVELASRLASAVQFRNTQALHDLIHAHGADPSAADYDSRTALHVAARSGDVEAARILVSAGAAINAVDAFANTPLDEAVRSDRAELINFLRERGAKTAKEVEHEREAYLKRASPKKVGSPEAACDTVVMDSLAISPSTPVTYNSSKAAVLIAPDNFNVNIFTAKDNALMQDATEVFERSVKEMPDGQRGVYRMILKEFADLHDQLVNTFGMDVFLFTHESFERIPDAVFVSDWFSTHSAEETGEPTLVLYSMRAPTRRGEKKDRIIRFLASQYKHIVDLSPCESGEVGCSEKFSYDKQVYAEDDDEDKHTQRVLRPRVSAMALDPVKPMEHSCVVMDRVTRTAYAASPLLRLDDAVLDLWAEKLNYKIVRFRLTTTSRDDLPFNHHSRPWLAIGTKFVIVCKEIMEPEDFAAVVKSASLNGARKVVEITLDQALSFAANGTQEVLMPEGKLGLLLSKNARKAITDQQFEVLESCVDKVAVVEFSLIEKLGGGSVSGVMNFLF